VSERKDPTSLASDSGRYYTLQAGVILGGLVSMPITTRLLSQYEYGVMSLTFALVGLGTVVGQLGFGNATTRFYAQHEVGGPAALRKFCEAMLTGALMSSLLLTALAGIAVAYVAGWSPGNSQVLLALAGIIIVTRVLHTVLFAVYRSRHAVGAFAAARLGCQWGVIILGTVLLLRRPSAAAVLVATVAVEAAVGWMCVVNLRRAGILRRLRWSWPIIREAHVYGWPLAFVGAAAIATAYADRMLIERYLGLDAVARYAVPYDLTAQLAQALFLPVQTAVLPTVFRWWATGREPEVRRALSTLATNLFALAIPVGALFIALNREIVTMLASAKYRDSAALTIYLLPGVFLNELSFLFAVGLRLSRETRAAALISIAGAFFNIAVNLVCLPRFGLPAAAAATSATYLVVTMAMYRWSRPVLQLHIRIALLAKSTAATLLMLLLVVGAGPVAATLPLDVAVRGTLGAVIAGGTLLASDRELRRMLAQTFATQVAS